MNKKVSKKSEEKLLDELLIKFTTSKHSSWNRAESQYDWQYCGVVEHDYDRYYHCNDEHEHCESICRCGTIENVKTFNYSSKGMVDNLTTGMSNEFLIYCIDRIVRLAKIDDDSFESVTCRGYYGEEIAGVYLNCGAEDFLTKNISKLKNLSDIEK